jgi:L-asparaginase II
MIRALDGWVAKGGAEGLYCAASADGLGLALKVLDGAFRAIQPALAYVLTVLGIDPGPLAESPVTDSLGQRVGELRVRPSI